MNEPPPHEERAAGEFFRAAWIFYLVLAIAGVLWLGFARGDIELASFLSRQSWPRDLGLGVATALALIGLWRLGRRLVPAMGELETQIAAAIGPVDRAEVVVLALVSGFAEELFFRGGMLASWGPYVSTLLFTLVHSGPGKAFRCWMVFALIAGSAFALLTTWTGNLLAAIVAHVAVNAVNLWRLAGSEEKAESADHPQKH